MSQSPSLGLMVMWFLVVLALIPVSLWVLKRSGMAQGRLGQTGGMRTIAQHAIGPGQRIVTVEVGEGEHRTWLVLGVTAHSIQTLHTLPPQAEAPAAAPQPGFAALLQHMRQGGDKGRS
jgi:flagellar protein FliO/FliZ